MLINPLGIESMPKSVGLPGLAWPFFTFSQPSGNGNFTRQEMISRLLDKNRKKLKITTGQRFIFLSSASVRK